MSGRPPPGPRPGCHDRAWNDPPLLGYSEATTKNTTKLNKRVGLPSEGSPPLPSSFSGGTGPPSSAPTLPLSAKPPPRADLAPPPRALTASAETGADSERQSVQPGAVSPEDVPDPAEVVSKLERAVRELEERLGRKKADDVRKRVETMRSQWESPLNRHVRCGMNALADALVAKEFDTSEMIQKTLVVDWPSLCASWMVGIKHLIQAAKSVEEAKRPLPDDDGGRRHVEKMSNCDQIFMLPEAAESAKKS